MAVCLSSFLLMSKEALITHENKVLVPIMNPETVRNAIMPLFIQLGYPVDEFFLNAEELLLSLIPKNGERMLPHRYLSAIRNVISFVKESKNNIWKLYKCIGFIYLNDRIAAISNDSSKEKRKISTKNIQNQFYLEYAPGDQLDKQKLLKLANDFKDTNQNSILFYQRFQEELDQITYSIINIFVGLNRCTYLIFQTSHIYNNNTIKNQGIRKFKDGVEQLLNTTERDFLSEDYFHFTIIRDFIINNIYQGFGNLPEVYNFDLNYGNHDLMMPAVFYEFFAFGNSIQINKGIDQGNICFPGLDRTKAIEKKYKLINVNGEQIKCCIHNNLINGHYEQILERNMQKEKVFLKFKYICCINSDIKYKIDFNGNIANFHPKISGNLSNGFWIDFNDSEDRYFYKELYCLSDKFPEIHQRITEQINNKIIFWQHGFTINRVELYMQINSPLIEDHPQSHENMAPHINSNYFLFSRRAENEYIEMEDQTYSHVNEYVELSGYFLLELFQMMPKVDAIYSSYYGKPIISVKGISNDYVLVKEEGRNPLRYDFEQIYDDKLSILMSSIPVQSLRLIQVIFQIDDFHEGNIAISVNKCTRQSSSYVANFEYIRSVQAIDIWPSYMSVLCDNINYILSAKDLSSVKKEDLTFDEEIMLYLDRISSDQMTSKSLKNIIQNDDKSLKDFYNSGTSRKDKSLRIQSFLSDQMEVKRNSNLPTKERVISAYFAMIDLFDEVYYRNRQLFVDNKLESHICVELTKLLLDETYRKSTTKALVKLPPLNNQSEKKTRNEWLAHFWEEYVQKSMKSCSTLLGIIGRYLFEYKIIDTKFAFKVAKNEKTNNTMIKYVVHDISFNDIVQQHYDVNNDTKIAIIFIGNKINQINVDMELPKFMEQIIDSKCPQMDIVKDNINIYIFESPVKFDTFNIFLERKCIQYTVNGKIVPNTYINRKSTE